MDTKGIKKDSDENLNSAVYSNLIADIKCQHPVGYRYFVLSINSSRNWQKNGHSKTLNDLLPNIELSRCVELGRFEVQGQACTIIQSSAHAILSLQPAERLTGRELQIVEWVAVGYSNKQIARHLQLSEWTVATHLRRVFTKLSVGSRAELVFRCLPYLKHLLEV